MDRGTLVRIILFVLAWVNSLLVQKGIQPLPLISEEVVAEVIAFVVSVWTLWKNQYISKKGKIQKEILDKHTAK
jgi:SPP1 family holin